MRARQRRLCALAVHRAVRRGQERLDPRRRAREGARQRADVRRLVDPRIQADRAVRHVLPARPRDVRRAPVARHRFGPHRPADLRRRRPRRPAVRGRSAHEPAARAQGGRRPGLHDERRPRGRVLPLQARRRRQPDRRPARRCDVLRRRADRPRRGLPARHRGHAPADGLRHRGCPPRGRDRPARDRLPPRRRARHCRQPDHLPGGRARRSPPVTGCTPRSWPSRSTARTARACTSTSRWRGATRTPSSTKATCSSSRPECRVHRRHPRAHPRRSPRSPTRRSTRTSGSCPATRRPSTSPGRPATARRRSASPRSAAARPASSCARPIRPRTRTWRWPCMLAAGLDGIKRGLTPPSRSTATSTT